MTSFSMFPKNKKKKEIVAVTFDPIWLCYEKIIFWLKN